MKSRTGPSNIFKFIWLTLIVGSMGCAPDEICFTDNDTTVKISFKTIIYPDTDSAFIETDTLIFSRVTALETDSIFVETDTLSALVLPVNTGSDRTVFILDSDRGSDTLEFNYKRVQTLISVDCGPDQMIDNLEAGKSTFDSLNIISPVLLEETDNVEVYR